MSKSKKKKPKACGSKQEEAARFNTFYKNLKELLDCWNCGHVLQLMDKHERQAFYAQRIQPVQVLLEPHTILTKDEVGDIANLLYEQFNEPKLYLEDLDKHFSLKQYLGGLMEIQYLTGIAENGTFKQSSAMAEQLKRTHNIKTLSESAEKVLQVTIMVVESFISNLMRKIVFITIRVNSPATAKNGRLGLTLVVKAKEVPVVQFKIEGHSRPGFRLACSGYDRGSEWRSVNRALFDNVPYTDNLELPVYIQSHVLQRMAERLDLVKQRHYHLLLSLALRKPNVIRYRHHYLIQFDIWFVKAGYLVAELINDMLLIKTFLFLTAEGTPEGEKLRKLSGLSKVDMQYWNIDRLSTFLGSDLSENPTLKQLFTDAGCGSLFNIDLNYELQGHNQLHLAEQLIRYMKQEDDNNDLPPLQH
ncbi:MAG: hypothetical protein ACK5JD_15440 [Mangrovibacterium sp.]